jgi:hypothetical protein
MLMSGSLTCTSAIGPPVAATTPDDDDDDDDDDEVDDEEDDDDVETTPAVEAKADSVALVVPLETAAGVLLSVAEPAPDVEDEFALLSVIDGVVAIAQDTCKKS